MNAIAEPPKVQEKAETIVAELRRMADWLEEHPDSATEMMCASTDYRGPRITLYGLASLQAAFPGKAALKSHCNTSECYKLTADGIAFEAWVKATPEVSEEIEVTL